MTKPTNKASSRKLQAPSHWERLLGKTRSAIERQFLDAFCELAFENGYSVRKTPDDNTLQVIPQKRIGRYSVDFAIIFRFFGKTLGLVVECDGHNFHEKMKAQVARDKTRERAIVAARYRVLRFSGSEIFADARGCAAEALDMIQDFQTACLATAA